MRKSSVGWPGIHHEPSRPAAPSGAAGQPSLRRDMVRAVTVPTSAQYSLTIRLEIAVARVCLTIRDDRPKAFQYTIKRNTVAVVSDGSAVLGLGDIGPEAAMPVMEGKAMLFKEFGNVDAF